MKDARGVTTVSEDEFLADDQVIDACVRAWLGPVALLTIGLRVVVASVEADQGHRSSKARRCEPRYEYRSLALLQSGRPPLNRPNAMAERSRLGGRSTARTAGRVAGRATVVSGARLRNSRRALVGSAEKRMRR
jgi:hypothetical protein